MAEKMLDSTSAGMTRSSSHLPSIYGNDSLELVWENGQILVKGGSINPCRGQEANHEDACIAKNARLNTLYSLTDFPLQRDSDRDSSHPNSHQSHDQNSCRLDLQISKSKSSSNHKDGYANLIPIRESKLTGGVHQPDITVNGNLCKPSTQQCLPSAPLKKPRIDSSQTPPTNAQKQDLGKVNFSNILRHSLFLKSTLPGNSLRNSATLPTKVATVATRSKAPDHSLVIDSSKGSHGLTGLQGQTPLISGASNMVSFAARSQEPLPDEHSEAVSHKSALSIHGYHGQYNNQITSSAEFTAKEKADTNFCNEPLVESSSVCSPGASDNTSLCIRKHEDTDDSTNLSDNDEEAEDVVKEKPAKEGTRGKRNRNAQTHNLNERKRRDNINKKMRVLKELIPNCNKVDKASMLDDAIEYLKTLKLQLQIMSMGTGLMPFMMLPTAPHHMINTPHFMGGGMGFRPGTGIPCSLPQFPLQPLPAMTDNRVGMFGFPNQVPPMPMSHAPFIPMFGNPSTQSLLATSTATNLAENLASGQLTTHQGTN